MWLKAEWSRGASRPVSSTIVLDLRALPTRILHIAPPRRSLIRNKTDGCCNKTRRKKWPDIWVLNSQGYRAQQKKKKRILKLKNYLTSSIQLIYKSSSLSLYSLPKSVLIIFAWAKIHLIIDIINKLRSIYNRYATFIPNYFIMVLS